MRAVTPSLILLSCLAGLSAPAQPVSVRPSGETQVTVRGGAGDQDVALVPNPATPAQSLIVVADPNVGLTTYRLDGTEVEAFLANGVAFGVDAREGFPFPGASAPLVVAADQSQALAAYVVDAPTQRLRRVDTGTLRAANFAPRTVALYRSASTGRFFAFAASTTGVVQQFELRSNDGGVDGTPVRTFDVGGAVIGAVADERQGFLFLVQQNTAVWRYGAEPTAGDQRTAVALAGEGTFSAPLGGVGLYTLPDGDGYLLAASTGADQIFAFRRQPPHTLVGTFSVGSSANGTIDEVTGTRSMEASSVALGPAFPGGLVLVHDTLNSPAQNHKLVSWSNVASAFSPPLRSNGPTDGGTTDGGTTDGGTTDGGTTDGGNGGGGNQPPGGGTIDPIDNGCSCAAASVPGTVLFVLVGLALRGRRRQR
jgi:3-phytase